MLVCKIQEKEELMSQILWIHAGPHKTASSYIQGVLASQRKNLKKEGLLVAKKPVAEDFARLFCSGDINAITQLRFIKKSKSTKLLSTEWLHPIVLEPAGSQRLELLSQAIDAKIGLIFFIRDQPNWINSMYCHTIRRMYHRKNFNDYVHSWCQQKSYWTLDFSKKFENIINKGFPTKFIPLSSDSDPYLNMLEEINFSCPQFATNGDTIKISNIQPGSKGIWMSIVCMKILNQLDIDLDTLKKRGRVIRKIAIDRNWHLEKYFGFDENLYDQTRNQFKAANSEFAKRFLNSSWEQHFPRKFTFKSVYAGPQIPGELDELENCFEQALRQMEIPDGLLSQALRLFREEALRTTH